MRRKQWIRMLIASILVCLITLGCSSSLLTREQQPTTILGILERDFPLCNDRSQAYEKLRLKEVDPVFRLCATELLKRTQVPIVLPPKVSQVISERPLYSRFASGLSGSSNYWIDLVPSPEEFDWIARFQAERVIPFLSQNLRKRHEEYIENRRKEAASLRANVNPQQRSAIHASGQIDLTHGITGYYRGIPSEIAWEDNGFQYFMTIKGEPGQAKILELANAAIENQQFNK